MNPYRAIGLEEFLIAYPRMKAQTVRSDELIIEGFFEFRAKSNEKTTIECCYRLKFVVPEAFPKELPKVYELERRIPQHESYHVNRKVDGSLCLGSRIRLHSELKREPTLSGYAKNFLIPYLYAVSHKIKHRGPFVFGELDHGLPGELDDYVDIFGLKTQDQARLTLRYLGMKKRRANKLACPCGCGRRLGVCRFNKRLRGIRKLAERKFFRSILS